MGIFTRDEPIGRDDYVRPALAWMIVPYLWLLVTFRLPLDLLPPQSPLSFAIAWVPYLLAVFAFVTLSMRRLLDLGAPRGLAWLALVPGAALPLFVVLAVTPGPTRTSADTR